MSARVVCDLKDVERDAVDARLAQRVQPGDVGTLVVHMLQSCGQLRVVMMLELNL
jgi:hypothetical protein